MYRIGQSKHYSDSIYLIKDETLIAVAYEYSDVDTFSRRDLNLRNSSSVSHCRNLSLSSLLRFSNVGRLEYKNFLISHLKEACKQLLKEIKYT